MNIGTFATLVAIVDRGSLTAAARQVGCTPSAVSLQVRQMEAYFGRALFDRSTRTVKPTAFGLEASGFARDLLARLQRLRTERGVAVAGRLRIGVIASVQTDPLPQALRGLRDRHPTLEVAVSLDDSDVLLADLKAGRIDAAVLVRPQAGGSSRLCWFDLARQPFVMLVPSDSIGDRPADLLSRLGWIRYDTSLTGGRIAARYVRRLVPEMRCSMELRSIDAIVAMVASGLGATVVPRPRQPLLGTYAVRELGLGRNGPTRQIALVCRDADRDSRSIGAVHRALLEAFG